MNTQSSPTAAACGDPFRSSTLVDKPQTSGLESKWMQQWDDNQVYAFDRNATRDEVYSIDTPPPTVSGSLHMGHIFSYTHTDIIARFQRMSGKKVFYTIGWDDNGLPSERRVQNYYGVRCDPSLPYDAHFQPPAKPSSNPAKQVPISRQNFIELCEKLTESDEQVFEQLFRQLGLSVDWSYKYATIDEKSRRISQRAFIHDLQRGHAYQAMAPTLWDTTFRTAVAQAELEDRERPSAYHSIIFDHESAGSITIETTRPELLAACVALVAHPDDERYQPLFGTTVTSPVFQVQVPVLAHHLAQPDKGSGIAMICTFGDLTDVIWWRELDLPTRCIIGVDGRILAQTPDALTSEFGRNAYQQLIGKTAHSAREIMVSLLRETGTLVGEPRKISHAVKFYEKGDKPLEIITTKQWYIRNGGRNQQLRQQLLIRGEELHWHPAFMQTRYSNWVNGLNGDWLISRQRFFGVSIPLWYRLDDNAQIVPDEILIADVDALPVDPGIDCPAGFTESQRGKPGGFIGETDIMDTWATSSLTPQIAAQWAEDSDLFKRVFPMDLRPQAHEIIRTWLFSTVLRSHQEFDCLPWSNTLISGWVLDPDRKKMSKSVGNVVTPQNLLDDHGSDAVRYWAASGRPGTDTAFDAAQIKVGRRLAIKLLNASAFVLGLGDTPAEAEISNPLDQAMLAELADAIADATAAFTSYDYTRALERVEAFFWDFCDNYVELVKARAYFTHGEQDAHSARASLRICLLSLVRLFAPFLPYTCEEIWSWWQEGSIHQASWPTQQDVPVFTSAPLLLEVARTVTSAVRKAKSEAQLSMKADVSSATIFGSGTECQLAESIMSDLKDVGHIEKLHFEPKNTKDSTLSVSVDLS